MPTCCNSFVPFLKVAEEGFVIINNFPIAQRVAVSRITVRYRALHILHAMLESVLLYKDVFYIF